MSSLPSGWARVPLAEIRHEKLGAVDPLKTPDQLYELYSVPAFPTGKPEVLPGKSIGSQKQKVSPGTVLICKINPRINRAWVVGNASQHPKLASTEWVAFPPVEGVAPRYLAYFFQQERFRDFLAANVSGVGGSLMRARKTAIDEYPFDIPPGAEQERISNLLDELLSDLDAGIASLNRARANLKRYRAAVLKAAVEGRLTERWRAGHQDVEPAEKLLARILAERRERWEKTQLAKYAEKGQSLSKGWRDKYLEPAKPEVSILPELSAGWCWATLDQLAWEVKNGTARVPAKEASGHRILRINAVRPLSVDLDEFRYVDLPEAEAHEVALRNGDLLFTRYNGSPGLVGVAGVVRHLAGELLHPDKLIRVRVLGDPLVADYLELACNVGLSREHIRRRTRTTAGQAGVSGADIRQIPIPVPPLEEMGRLVEEVARSLSLISASEAHVEAGLRRAGSLRRAILKLAFEGKLVPQDSSDEPASELLARIRTGRAEVRGQKAVEGRREKRRGRA